MAVWEGATIAHSHTHTDQVQIWQYRITGFACLQEYLLLVYVVVVEKLYCTVYILWTYSIDEMNYQLTTCGP